jgi:hypothetical protein
MKFPNNAPRPLAAPSISRDTTPPSLSRFPRPPPAPSPPGVSPGRSRKCQRRLHACRHVSIRAIGGSRASIGSCATHIARHGPGLRAGSPIAWWTRSSSCRVSLSAGKVVWLSSSSGESHLENAISQLSETPGVKRRAILFSSNAMRDADGAPPLPPGLPTCKFFGHASLVSPLKPLKNTP